MKKTMVIGIALVASIALMFTSCASSGDDGAKKEKKGKAAKLTEADYLNFLNEGDFVSCIKYLEEKNAKNEKKVKDYIRDYYDIAMMNHFAGNLDASIEGMNEVDELMKAAMTKSLSKATGAALINENIADYAGLPYEYFYINIFNALNYYKKGDIDEAAVEARKLNNKHNEYRQYNDLLKDYDPDAVADEVAEEGEEASEDKPKMTSADALAKLGLDTTEFNNAKPAKPADSDYFYDSAAAAYLRLLFYMMEDEIDDAKREQATIAALGNTYDASGDLSLTKDQGRLDVLAFTGLIGRRGEQRRIFGPFEGIRMDINGMALIVPPFDLEYCYPVYPAPQAYEYPVMEIDLGFKKPLTIGPGKAEVTVAPTDSIASVKVVMADGTEVVAAELEDFSSAVARDVNTKARRAYNRSMGRSISKKVSTIIGSSATLLGMQQSGLDGMPVELATIALAKVIDLVDMSETADIRQVYALPSKVQVAGVTMAPGTYSFKVQYMDAEGNVVEEQEYNDVAVAAGVPTIVEAICRK